MKRFLKWVGAAVAAVALGAAIFVGAEVRAFDRSMQKVYEVPPPGIVASTFPNVIARGKHLAESLGGCATADCHGADLGGGHPIQMGPVGTLVGPNITAGGSILGNYSDGELARLILHGIKHDGRSVRFMTVEDFNWLPDDDVEAIVSYVRAAPAVHRETGATHIGVLGKVLDRLGKMSIDVARRIDHVHRAAPPPPSPTAKYGGYVALMCYGCHGQHLSGGPIPGAPASMAIPTNITPDPSGIQAYTYADFTRLIETGVRPNGKKLAALMPVEALRNMNEVERRALWEFLRTVPPLPFGRR